MPNVEKKPHERTYKSISDFKNYRDFEDYLDWREFLIQQEAASPKRSLLRTWMQKLSLHRNKRKQDHNE